MTSAWAAQSFRFFGAYFLSIKVYVCTGCPEISGAFYDWPKGGWYKFCMRLVASKLQNERKALKHIKSSEQIHTV